MDEFWSLFNRCQLWLFQLRICCISSITVHGKEPLPTLDASEVQEVRKELVAIRDKVNILLNAIDGNSTGSFMAAEVMSREGRTVASSTSNTGGSQDVAAKAEPAYRKGVSETSGALCACVLNNTPNSLLCKKKCTSK